MSLRHRFHQILEGNHDPLSGPVRWFLAGLVIANVFAVVIETVPEVEIEYGAALHAFETFSLFIFGVEYLLRLWSCAEHARFQGTAGRLRWIVTPGALVDMAAILPALLLVDLRLVRIVRIARLVRIAKLGRYSLALRTLRHVMFARLPDLISLSFVLMILLIFSSALMFHLEHDAQPELFSSIPATMWWGIVTLTTIGYGDMAPVTVEGRLLGSVVAVLGIGMFALPAGLLGGAFVEEMQRARQANRRERAQGGASQTSTQLAPRQQQPAAHHCPPCRPREEL